MQTLTGSEKQVTWAAKIRTEKLADIDATIAKLDAANPNPDLRGRAMREQVISARERIAEQTSAAWWIDARYDDARLLIQKMIAG